jgi:hypothetical protein
LITFRLAQVLGGFVLRVEEANEQLRVVVPASARVSERLGWSLAGGVLGLLGTMALASIWAQITTLGRGLAWAIPLLFVASCLFAKAARLGDIVWTFDRGKQTLEHAGRVVARFNELGSARCRVSTGRSGAPLYELVIVLRRNRSFRDVRLASTAQAFGSGTPAQRAHFEQAAARIADILHVTR